MRSKEYRKRIIGLLEEIRDRLPKPKKSESMSVEEVEEKLAE